MQYVTVESVQGVCPIGWHLPYDDEWKTLEIELGMTQAQADAVNVFRGTDQGSQLAGNELLWTNGALDQNGTFGSSGFTALPGGQRISIGAFLSQSMRAAFWSSSESNTTAWTRLLKDDDSGVERAINNQKTIGNSVRCVKD